MKCVVISIFMCNNFITIKYIVKKNPDNRVMSYFYVFHGMFAIGDRSWTIWRNRFRRNNIDNVTWSLTTLVEQYKELEIISIVIKLIDYCNRDKIRFDKSRWLSGSRDSPWWQNSFQFLLQAFTRLAVARDFGREKNYKTLCYSLIT